MARLVLNSNDFTDRLTGFELRCKKCGSTRVTLDSKHDETIYDS